MKKESNIGSASVLSRPTDWKKLFGNLGSVKAPAMREQPKKSAQESQGSVKEWGKEALLPLPPKLLRLAE